MVIDILTSIRLTNEDLDRLQEIKDVIKQETDLEVTRSEIIRLGIKNLYEKYKKEDCSKK